MNYDNLTREQLIEALNSEKEASDHYLGRMLTAEERVGKAKYWLSKALGDLEDLDLHESMAYVKFAHTCLDTQS